MAPIPFRGQKRGTETRARDQIFARVEVVGYYAGVIEGIVVYGMGLKVEMTVGPETCIAKFELPAAP